METGWGGLLRVIGATKHTADQIKSHKKEALRMEKQHTMFASYIAPAEPSIEGEQWPKSAFVATTRPQIVSALTEFPGSKSQIGLEGVKNWLHSLYPQRDSWRLVFTCGLASSRGVKQSRPRVSGRRFAYNLSRRRTTLEG